MANPPSFSLTPIAYVRSPYKEKFAIPRQPGLVPAAKGQVYLCGEFNDSLYIEEITQFSHIWLQFIFHQTINHGWQPRVRPPRLGGNRKVGVFASRATFRPNALGLSVVKLEGVRCENKQWILDISGFDLLDQTPVVDIKPYLPYSDAVLNAVSGYATAAPATMKVRFLPEVIQQLSDEPDMLEFIQQVLAQDPRPAYRHNREDPRTYGVQLGPYNINWQVINNEAVVTAVSDC